MGDFNIDVAKPDNNARNFVSRMQCLHLEQLISVPTRITNTSKSTIDHIYTNICSCQIDAGTIIADISDHFPVFSIFDNFNIHLPILRSVLVRDFKCYNKDNFVSDLRKVDWNILNNNSNADTAFDTFHDLFIQVCDLHAPLKVKTLKSKRNKNPWITKAIKKMSKLFHTGAGV